MIHGNQEPQYVSPAVRRAHKREMALADRLVQATKEFDPEAIDTIYKGAHLTVAYIGNPSYAAIAIKVMRGLDVDERDIYADMVRTGRKVGRQGLERAFSRYGHILGGIESDQLFRTEDLTVNDIFGETAKEEVS